MSVVKFIEKIIIVLKGAKKKSSDLHFSTRNKCHAKLPKLVFFLYNKNKYKSDFCFT